MEEIVCVLSNISKTFGGEVFACKNVNLKWSVVESLPVHNDIKKRSGRYKYFIDQYKDSLVNLSKSNIKSI